MNTPSSSNPPVKIQSGGLLGLLPAVSSSALPLLLLIPVLQSRSQQSRPRQTAQAPEPPAAPQPEAAAPVMAAGRSEERRPSAASPGANYGPGPRKKSSRKGSPRGPEAFPRYNQASNSASRTVPVSDFPESRPASAEAEDSIKADAPPEVVPTSPVRRRSIPPMDLLGFLSDASPFIPGINQRPISHMMRARDIAGQIRSMRENPAPTTLATASSRNPSETPLGIISALRRNMQGNVPSVLSKAEQTMQLVNTLRGGGASNLMQTMNGLMGNSGPISAVSNIINDPPPASPDSGGSAEVESKVGSALSQALVNMDEGKRQQFVKMAQDIINKMK